MDKWLNTSKNSGNNPTSTATADKKRKYDDGYIQFGFICAADGESPLCLVCNKTLQNSSMAPSKLKRHLTANHPALAAKPKTYFEELRNQNKTLAKKMKTFSKISDKATVASYKIAQLLCKKKKSHIEAESVILPAILIAVEIMLGAEFLTQIKKIPLSDNTISRRIQEMSEDIDAQVRDLFDDTKDLFSSLWALQIDESTDISGKAQLIAYIRYIRNGKINNQFLFCLELVQTTTGQDVFKLVDENIRSRNLKWKNCVSICTDGAPSMLGKIKGFAALVLAVNPSVMIVHCMIHREALMTKVLPENLQLVMRQVVVIVNFIKANALRSRIFSVLCEAMDSDYQNLLFHTDVRWLSKGKVLQRVCHLKVEIISFLETENLELQFDIHSDLWWLKVAFLSDLFEKLNVLNKSLQGPNENLVTATGKLNSFEKKLVFWKNKLLVGSLESFPMTDKLSNKNMIIEDIKLTLRNLQKSMTKYFPSLDVEQYDWVLNPFGNCEAKGLSTLEEEQLIDLKEDSVLKTSFLQVELSEFWISLHNQFPELSLKAVKILLPFATSYLCELGFSALTEIKSKKRARLLMVDQEMRVCLSLIEPRIENLCSESQCHPSN